MLSKINNQKRNFITWFNLILVVIFITAAFFVFNINVSTKQCINYECQIKRTPLYLKLIDFFDRHLNYAQLVKNIIKDANNEEERAIRILEWTKENIRKVPEGFPIIDDHVWHIIVRGYGADDQSQDVFTTLCNHARIQAFFTNLKADDSKIIPLSCVKLNNKWSVFDAYNGVIFRNKNGDIASIDDLYTGNWQGFCKSNNDFPDFHNYYTHYFKNLYTIDFEKYAFSRAAIQSPMRRFIFWVKQGR